MSLFFPQAISLLAEAMVSVQRLQNFMLYEEMSNPSTKSYDNLNKTDNTSNYNNIYKNDKFNNLIVLAEEKLLKDVNNEVSSNEESVSLNAIVMKNMTSKWSRVSSENTLNEVTIDFQVGKLTAIIGLVGSGKSSLLHVILRELPVKSGKLEVRGSVSYASQEPWLFAGSVRQNILFGEPFDRDRYREVTSVCALRTDFSQMPYGDKTIVGDRGVSLSGGQRARINLARAIYKKADIYLLDDPLSAVDTHVAKHLFEDCILGYLKKKTCILVTHQLQFLNNLEHIVMLENGSVIVNGSYEMLVTTGKYFANLLTSTQNEVDKNVEGDNTSVKELYKRQSSVQSLASSMDDRMQDEPPEMAEMRAFGTISFDVYLAYFKASGTCCFIFGLLLLCVLTQFLASFSDYWITFWVILEEKEFSIKTAAIASEFGKNVYNNVTPVYDSKAIDNINIVYNASRNFSEPVDDFTFSKIFEFDRDVCILIFAILTVATVIATLIRTFLMFGMCINASINLHNNMFNNIVRATMKFFNTNSSGRILNRFSKDMGSIDEMLPVAVIDCISISLVLVGIISIISFVNYWLLVPTFLIGVLFYFLREFYLNTSRSIKRLEGVTRSPIFSHLSASLQGLSTIRAFRSERILEKEFDNHLDLHTSAWYIFMASNHAFGFWLDFICLIYIALVTLSFLVMETATFGGNVGLAITQALALTGMFQWFMRQTAELENFMTSVERVLEYTNLEKESPLESLPGKNPPASWPSEGKLVFSRVFLKYSITDPPVLKNLTFTVEPGEKVGIVGRTGAGKSSLITALYRLSELSGEIFIDDVATSSIGLHELRSKISIIPQEPFLFSGSMRKNLDPFDEFPDGVLWSALEEVKLKDAVNDLPGGLEAKMSEGGSNFSVGQRQLVCLARAIIRNNKILVLDEATANVDPQTDTLIQSTIRRKFADCTMLTIAHRLHTIMDADKVLVMDAGILVEFNHPHILLKEVDGYFYKMVEQTGKSTADMLHKIAANNYKKYIDED